ncbi:g6f-like [Megalops cyprinoides]|uniref:g6f-like n=1 Tax=Megalops cyprinoides TaxID=118141 RepID=UPI001864F3AF|nr:g6f-like [Megalops cyprinoides]
MAVVLFFPRSISTKAERPWSDVVVAEVGTPVTLACSDWPLRGSVKLNWYWKPDGLDSWSLVMSASERQQFLGGASKRDMRLADSNFQKSGDFSLFFNPRSKDGGRYSCLIEQGERKLRQKIILLVILTVKVIPPQPIPEDSTLCLITEVSSHEAVSEVAWFSPLGQPLRSETGLSGEVVCKLPRIDRTEQGNYTCQIQPLGNCSRPLFLFTYTVTIDVTKVAKFSNITHGPLLSAACLSRTPLPLPCTSVSGDYVMLYWQHPDSEKMERVFSYDRWRRGYKNQTKPRLHLASTDSANAGSFSFLLYPELREGGVYLCEVFLNDIVFSQSMRVSVLHVYAKSTPSALVLWCQYSERSQVKRVSWTHQNQSYRLSGFSNAPGRLSTEVPLPLKPEVAGNYTCTIELKNGKKARAVHTVTLPPTVNTYLSSPSLLPSLSALGLLVPLVAVAAGVLLWKRGHRNTHPGIEQSLSHCSGEVENIYENPDDLRQTPAQSAVYMDLKPTKDNDVYKELDRYEQCSC